MPVVNIRTGVIGSNGREEVLSEYLCDCADCPNTAEHVIGVVREIGGSFAVCTEHAAVLARRARRDSLP
jgi:hypothetical protein